MMTRQVYLVGSVPLANSAEVFTTVSAALGPHLVTLPDGETGERLDWITWLEPIFADNPAFEPSGETFQLHSGITRKDRRYRLKPGVSISNVRFDNLFYADIAIRSYAVFAELKRQGKIPAQVKFQVDLVPAHSVIWLFVQEELQRAIDPIYNDAVRREIDKLAAQIPHDQLAIQFDVASAVFARLERNQPGPYGDTKEEMQDTFSTIVVGLAEHVPADIDLLFHFCYGDAGHRHVVEPTDMGDMVDYANRLSERLQRPITQIHMPVPRDRTDSMYFKPLKRLRLDPETRLCLGLVHYTDGIAGTRKRVAAAAEYLEEFSIGTECGFGRRDPATIAELLRIHAAVAGGA
jgi:methionine synthase II (cobalamin-independent)